MVNVGDLLLEELFFCVFLIFLFDFLLFLFFLVSIVFLLPLAFWLLLNGPEGPVPLGDMVGEEVAMTVRVWQQLGHVGWVGQEILADEKGIKIRRLLQHLRQN